MQKELSIIIPARNEADTLGNLLPEIIQLYPEAEIIVVNDGSTDNTEEVVAKLNIKLISNPYPMGNGAAIKTGVRSSTGKTLIFMDGDGQHLPLDISKLLDKLGEGYDMAVGARNMDSHANLARRIANKFYNHFSSWVSGHKIRDLTSGFRAVRAEKFKEFIYLLPNGFSYPTTITMAMFRAGYKIAYVPVNFNNRIGKSHIKPFVDGIRFLLIIFRVGTLYSPLKIFAPISAFFFLSGMGYYIFTFVTQGRFTNMSTLLFICSILIFLIGLISEQLTVLLYASSRYHADK